MTVTSAGDRELDFILIGVQKGGTTSLWRYLKGHPLIAMPDFNEAAVFCLPSERVAGTLAELMRSAYGDPSPDVMLGKGATHYMRGMRGVSVELVAERIASALPQVRLIALLRDPIERAVSHYRMSLRRGLETRSLDRAVGELLDAGQLERSRAVPSEANSYLVQGEYGRILAAYRARFPREQIHVATTEDLGRQPGVVLDRVLEFLDLPSGFRPGDLGVRHHRGGSRSRLDPAGEAELRAFVAEQVLPALGDRRRPVEAAFDFFMQTWNVVPDERRPALSEANRQRLEAHYRRDAELLAGLGLGAPWLAAWAR